MEFLLSSQILEKFVEQTNLKVSKQVNPKWDASNQLSVDELKQYIAIDIYMDVVVRKGSVKTYWERTIWGDNFIKSIVTRDRFMAIRDNLTCTDTSDMTEAERAERNRLDGFWTIADLFDKLVENFQTYYIPYRRVSIDEMCIFFKGRHRCRCYNPNKPNKWHFKPVHMLSSFPPKRVEVERNDINAQGQFERLPVGCPTVVKEYNSSMGAVDMNDQKAAYYDARFRVQARWQPRMTRRGLKTALVKLYSNF